MAKLLEEHEIEALVQAYVNGTKNPNENVAVKLVSWAEQAIIDSTFVDMLIKGYCTVDEIDGQWGFSITDKGLKAINGYRLGIVQQLFPNARIGEGE